LMPDRIPTFKEFLATLPAKFAPLAPKTMIFAAGGTRRRAALAGIDPASDSYPQWSFYQMMACFDLFFQHGVRQIITHAIIPSQYSEVTKGYRDNLTRWVAWNLSNPEALAEFQRRGVRVRLLGAEDLPDLSSLAETLQNFEAPAGAPTIWFTVSPTESTPWRALFAAVHRSGAETQREAIQAQFGESIPPASLYIGSGKPGVFPAVVPPLLMGKMQCYWSQRPGFITDIETVKAILYDFAYTRKTWMKDKTGRAEKVLEEREIWEGAPILGLGVQLGPFWYPAPVPDIVDKE
jgi:hypothetical protein